MTSKADLMAVAQAKLSRRLDAAAQRYVNALPCNARHDCTSKHHLPICPHATEQETT